MTVRPATVTVPLRAGPALADAVTCTLPSSVPPAPEGTESQEVVVDAPHRQPEDVVTENVTDRVMGVGLVVSGLTSLVSVSSTCIRRYMLDLIVRSERVPTERGR